MNVYKSFINNFADDCHDMLSQAKSFKFVAILLQLTLMLCLITISLSVFMKFTNYKCVSYDTNFAQVRHCYLKLIKRNTVALNSHFELKKTPWSPVKVWLTYSLNMLVFNFTNWKYEILLKSRALKEIQWLSSVSV